MIWFICKVGLFPIQSGIGSKLIAVLFLLPFKLKSLYENVQTIVILGTSKQDSNKNLKKKKKIWQLNPCKVES